MKRTSIFVFTLLFFITFSIFSQKRFDFIIDKDSTEYGHWTFENNNGKYITLGSVLSKDSYQTSPTKPIIIEYSDSVDILVRTFSKIDTSFSFFAGFQKINGNYYIIGTLSDSTTMLYHERIYLCELAPDFQVIWEKSYPAPEGYALYLADYVIDNDENIVVFASMEIVPYSNQYLFLSKFDMYGNLLNSNFLPDYHAHTYNDLILKPDHTGYFIIGGLTLGDGFTKNWFEIDTSLNVINTGDKFGDNWLEAPLSAKWLSNGNLFIVNSESQETPGAYNDFQVRISNPNFNTVRDTLIIETDNLYTPVYKGVDYYYEDLVWSCTFDQGFTFWPGTKNYTLYLFDSEMNLLGKKIFGGYSRWWFYHLLATSDGGCIITGIIREPEGNEHMEYDLYVQKVMPDDVITNIDDVGFRRNDDVLVYPNPFKNKLKIQSNQKGLKIILFDSMGRIVMEEKINNNPQDDYKTDYIKTGLYYYQISNNNRTIKCGKLIKQ
jgi:hypothetical protein